jgi:ribosomal protein S18 acetylase RimI-like enzyme
VTNIVYFESVGHCAVWSMIPEAMDELARTGIGFTPADPPVWSDACLAQIDEYGQVRGFIVYRWSDQRAEWFVMLAYVVPKWRRTGVHTSLFRMLVERAEKRGDIRAIVSGTHVDNNAAQAAFKSQGRKPISIMYEYVIKEWLSGTDPLEIKG